MFSLCQLRQSICALTNIAPGPALSTLSDGSGVGIEDASPSKRARGTKLRQPWRRRAGVRQAATITRIGATSNLEQCLSDHTLLVVDYDFSLRATTRPSALMKTR
jgi:hypothetical protein